MTIHVSKARDAVAIVGFGPETPARNPGNDEVPTPLSDHDLIKHVKAVSSGGVPDASLSANVQVCIQVSPKNAAYTKIPAVTAAAAG